jgi:gliding motility-associated lipoprotein GldH
MIKGTNRYFSILLLIVFMASCGKNVIFTDSEAMTGKTWKISDMPVFKIPVKDTINSNNIYFIYIFATTTAPDGKSITDTLRYDLADEKGNWYGKGFGDIHELKLPYKSNVFFPVSGIYQINIQHGMRVEDLKGVYDFGLRVEKTIK